MYSPWFRITFDKSGVCSRVENSAIQKRLTTTSDRPILVDFCHHLLSSTHWSIVTNHPHLVAVQLAATVWGASATPVHAHTVWNNTHSTFYLLLFTLFETPHTVQFTCCCYHSLKHHTVQFTCCCSHNLNTTHSTIYLLLFTHSKHHTQYNLPVVAHTL